MDYYPSWMLTIINHIMTLYLFAYNRWQVAEYQLPISQRRFDQAMKHVNSGNDPGGAWAEMAARVQVEELDYYNAEIAKYGPWQLHSGRTLVAIGVEVPFWVAEDLAKVNQRHPLPV